MYFRAVLAKIGQAAHLPQPGNLRTAAHRSRQIGIFSETPQHCQIDRLGRAGEFGALGRAAQIGDQCRHRAAIGFGIAPEQFGQRGKAVFFDRVYFFGGERGIVAAAARQCAEGAVALMTSGASGDLRHFRRGQAALALTIEFGQARKRNVIDIEVEPHPDRVGRDQIIDLARLVQGYLPVARFGRKRPHHHRCAAAKPPQHFGHGINLLGRERDNRTARRDSRQLARAAVAERGKAWT